MSWVTDVLDLQAKLQAAPTRHDMPSRQKDLRRQLDLLLEVADDEALAILAGLTATETAGVDLMELKWHDQRDQARRRLHPGRRG